MPDLISLICPSGGGKMKSIFPRLAISILLVILLTACDMPQGGNTGTDTGTVATKVVLTLAALTQSAQQTPLASPRSPSSPTLVQPTTTQTPTLTPTLTPIEIAGSSPTLTPTLHPTDAAVPSSTATPPPGTIAGNITGYPYGSIPGLAIVAFQQEAPYHYWYWLTTAGSSYYSMDGYISTGNYQVVAYDSSGHAGGCTVNVLVISNQTVNCDITNWGGGYPAKPSGVPTP
jgi:hypothetical protein